VILITTSGARFGLRATLPHIAGIVLGVGITAGLTGLGIGALLADLPVLKTGLSVLAAAWILWMAVQLWRASRRRASTAEDRPWGVARAALFQWVNPKLWAITLAAASGYRARPVPVGGGATPRLSVFGNNLFVCLFWAFTGALFAVADRRSSVADLHPCHGHRGLAVSAVMVFV
jgi:threonine/homoserine/homoserine lactone efflux protein